KGAQGLEFRGTRTARTSSRPLSVAGIETGGAAPGHTRLRKPFSIFRQRLTPGVAAPRCRPAATTVTRRRRPGAAPRGPARGGRTGPRAIQAPSGWREPYRWDRKAAAGERRRVFCASLADFFEDRPELVLPRKRVWLRVRHTPNLDGLLLTKRPE